MRRKLEIVNVDLNDYKEDNKIIYYNIDAISNQLFVINDFLMIYNKLYYLNFKTPYERICKDKKIQILLKIPSVMNAENIKYSINEFYSLCSLSKKSKNKINAYLVINTEDKTYYFDSDKHKFFTMTTENMITDIYFILNFKADIDYNNIKSIGYNIYFNPIKLNIIYKKSINKISEIIQYNFNLNLRIIDCGIDIEEIYFDKTDLRLYDYTRLRAKITSKFPIKDYKIKDLVNKKNIQLKDEGYDKELDKYIYTINKIFVLQYENQMNSLYNFYIRDCNYYFIKEKRKLSINYIKNNISI